MVQALRYHFAIGVDRAVVYDRWGVLDEALAPFVKEGKAVVVRTPPFYRNTSRKMNWIIPLMKPYMPDRFTYSDEKQMCVYGAATDAEQKYTMPLDPKELVPW
eukprot:g421.t1